MWNDTDIPLAYLITFRCYGTWLHGDERGSIDRFNNRYDEPPNTDWLHHNARRLKATPVELDAKQRKSVEEAILETCSTRKWLLRAVNVRTITLIPLSHQIRSPKLSSTRLNQTPRGR